jgi:ribonuclease-3
VSDARLPASLEAIVGPSSEMPHLAEALTHPSYANELRRGAVRLDYQRLEFLGDAVLQLCISEALVERFPDAGEGELSRRRANVVGTDGLAAFARLHDLGSSLRLGRGADASGERTRPSVLADALEAVVAAVHLDLGLAAARTLALAILDAVGDAPFLELDPKSALQERIQAGGEPAPTYALVAEEGPPHERIFVVRVDVGDRALGEGRGRSKKVAEQEAARVALASLDAPG